MNTSHFIIFSALIVICASQRSPYAGRRPIGFPVIETTTLASPQNDSLGNRFDTPENATTQRLPIEALGDRDLINRLGQFPQDKQPFWFINWQALEQHRQKPQSYPLRPSSFAANSAIPVQTVQTNQVSTKTNQVSTQTNQSSVQINRNVTST
ncbi:uncharacterized protein LOC125069931 isoform X2 [Vanessa atalanta]|uniref:uncharacterized protein LOC125069931 isoform X2 n=1 Tax=Vanessa atalanta TaxID=42275 RepID=UPI001FCDBEFC|nr:uncharacterized protein LOC125069931 isoform X2 [Vanessa atalanta]